jgi:hypothetical protein
MVVRGTRENRVVGPREQSKCQGLGLGRVEEKQNSFSWGGEPQGRGMSWIRVGEQENASSGCQGVRPVSWVLDWPRRV